MRRSLYAILLLIVCLASHTSTVVVHAFGVSSSPLLRTLDVRSAATTSTALHAQESEEGSRRGFIATVKRLFLGVGGVSTLGGRPLAALAEDTDSSQSGNVVEIQVSNLDGNPDSKGTIKIKMKPDWAPRGVARFEVRFANARAVD